MPFVKKPVKDATRSVHGDAELIQDLKKQKKLHREDQRRIMQERQQQRIAEHHKQFTERQLAIVEDDLKALTMLAPLEEFAARSRQERHVEDALRASGQIIDHTAEKTPESFPSVLIDAAEQRLSAFEALVDNLFANFTHMHKLAAALMDRRRLLLATNKDIVQARMQSVSQDNDATEL